MNLQHLYQDDKDDAELLCTAKKCTNAKRISFRSKESEIDYANRLAKEGEQLAEHPAFKSMSLKQVHGGYNAGRKHIRDITDRYEHSTAEMTANRRRKHQDIAEFQDYIGDLNYSSASGNHDKRRRKTDEEYFSKAKQFVVEQLKTILKENSSENAQHKVINQLPKSRPEGNCFEDMACLVDRMVQLLKELGDIRAYDHLLTESKVAAFEKQYPN